LKEIEKEIVIIRNMIDVLNRCLMISISKAEIREIIKTKKDIRMCKKELHKLIEAKDVAKEQAKDESFQ
jgi:hypothetical protein